MIKILLATLFVFTLFVIPRILTANQGHEENKAPGLVNGQLQKCPDRPNCINSEYLDDAAHYLPPLEIPALSKAQVLAAAKKIIIRMDGKITFEQATDKDNYLAATFTSSLFRFVDDFELRLDHTTQKLHIRSASRSGYSDFGVNKRRVETFSKQFKEQLLRDITK